MYLKNKAVIFDFNGTMIFDRRIQEESWRVFIKNKIGRSITDEEFGLYIHGRNPDVTMNYFFEKDFSKPEADALTEEKEIYYRQLCLENPNEFRLADGLPVFLERLKAQAVPITIATASPFVNLRFFFKELNLSRWFDINACLWSDGSFEGKPKPDIYLKAAKKLNKAPKSCIVFEDSEAGTIAAAAANIGFVVGVSSMLDKERLTMAGADLVIENYLNL